MPRKPGPPGEDDAVAPGSLEQLELLRRRLVELVFREREGVREARRREQANLIRRFVHDHAPALHLLAARLGGREEAMTVAQEAIANLAQRIWMMPRREAMELVTDPERLWCLICKLIGCRAYDHLKKRPPNRECDVDRVQLAHDLLSPAERVIYILHHYYGFTDSDFEVVFCLS